ncbi:hypothetical protein Droror1_Dr00017968 [Drosera rotundifolia]
MHNPNLLRSFSSSPNSSLLLFSPAPSSHRSPPSSRVLCRLALSSAAFSGRLSRTPLLLYLALASSQTPRVAPHFNPTDSGDSRLAMLLCLRHETRSVGFRDENDGLWW